MNVPIPKLAMIGVVVLLIGFSPAILAWVDIDSTAPSVMAGYPAGSSSSPTDVEPSKPETIHCLVAEQPSSVWVEIDDGADGTVDHTLNLPYIAYAGMGWYKYGASYTWTSAQDIKIKLVWKAKDAAGWVGSATSYAHTGGAQGKFYIKGLGDWEEATTTSTHAFKTRTIQFKFESSTDPKYISPVEIDVVGVTKFSLGYQLGTSTWGPESWTAPNDGTYEIHGYFTAFNQRFQGMSLFGGFNVDPTPPSEWSMYDWLKILGGALIVVGFIVKK